MLSVTVIAAILTCLGAGIMGGFMLAFSLTVMPALDRRPAREALETMLAINRFAEQPAFLSVFFGTAIAAIVAVISTLVSPGGLATPLVVAGGIVSLCGTAVTVCDNVPRNRRLARASADRAAPAWRAFSRPWRRSNHVRTVCWATGCALLALSVVM